MLPREAAHGRRPAEPAARPLRRVAGLALLAVAIAGCGEEAGSPATSPAVTASELAITVDPDGAGGEPALEETVACPGGDAAACDAISALPADSAAPVPAGTACTEIYGGPDIVTISGTLSGEAIDATLTRENGCEIDRFERFAPLLTALFPAYTPGESLAP